jgi:hypothetical protein
MTTSALSRKLQIKPGNRVLLLNAPEGYAASLDPLPEGAAVATAARGRFDVVHLFARDSRDLARDAPKALKAVADGGVLWISYPKRSSGVETDLTRDIGWKVVEEAGWGGVAQVAIDEVWSALRFRPGAEIQRTAPARAQSAAAGAPGRARGAGTSNKEAQAPGVEAPRRSRARRRRRRCGRSWRRRTAGSTPAGSRRRSGRRPARAAWRRPWR